MTALVIATEVFSLVLGAATYYGFLTVLFGISLLPLAIGFLPKLYSEVIWKKTMQINITRKIFVLSIEVISTEIASLQSFDSKAKML